MTTTQNDRAPSTKPSRGRQPGATRGQPQSIPRSTRAPAHEPLFFGEVHEIPAQLARLEGHRDRGAIHNSLCDVQAFLRQEFAAEEGAAGLFDLIGNAAPEGSQRLLPLRREHRRILASITGIRTTLPYLSDDLVSLRLARLRVSLQAHIRHEQELVRMATGRPPADGRITLPSPSNEP